MHRVGLRPFAVQVRVGRGAEHRQIRGLIAASVRAAGCDRIGGGTLVREGRARCVPRRLVGPLDLPLGLVRACAFERQRAILRGVRGAIAFLAAIGGVAFGPQAVIGLPPPLSNRRESAVGERVGELCQYGAGIAERAEPLHRLVIQLEGDASLFHVRSLSRARRHSRLDWSSDANVLARGFPVRSPS